MLKLAGKVVLYSILLLAVSSHVHAQTTATYHLHGDTGTYQLRLAPPDITTPVAIQSAELKGLTGEQLIKTFSTIASPNGTGAIPSGSPIQFIVYMKKTANAGVMYPCVKLYLNNASGPLIGAVTGTSPLNSTLSVYTLTVNTNPGITMTSSDDFYLWVGVNIATSSGNTKVKAELDIEGTLNGNYDSRVTIPVPPPATITNVSPTSGISGTFGSTGTAVTINGTNFGATVGRSAATFNGVAAPVTSWSNTSISVTVPEGATTGPVVVVQGTVPSNGVQFSVTVPGRIGGYITKASDGTAIGGALIEALQSGVVKGSGTSASDSLYNVWGLLAGTYDMRISASGYLTQQRTGVVVTSGGVTTVSAAMSPGGIITGTITRASNGAAISGALVEALQSGTVIASTTTASGGTYTINTLPTGTYDLRVSATGFVPAVRTGNAVTQGLTTTLNVALNDPPSISNISPTSGPTGVSVTVTGSNFGATQGTSTLTFNGVAATPTNWTNTSIAAPVPAGAGTGPAVVTVSGVASNGVNFTLITTGTISGAITRTSNGTAISGALVEALQAGIVKASNSTASDGTYAITNLAAGTYDVRVSASGFGTEGRTALSVQAAGTTTLNVALSVPGSITGKITQEDGTTPIAGASVKALQGSVTVGTATANGTGDYTISSLGPQSYTLTASATGYEPKSQTGVAVTSGSATTVNLSLNAASIVYVYDDLGRLGAAIDTSGDTAVYHYDSVGNLLSISRQNSTTVTVIGFSPNSGSVGMSVTINGVGFSSIPGENTVKFNGVTAAVTSATTTQIVATVPSGATTGPITVATPAGSATSSSPFTVTNSAGAPTITGLNPQIVRGGDVFNITGTGFDPNPINDRVTVNLSSLQTTQATSVSVSAQVQDGMGSGHVSVSTPGGAVVSSADLFVVPGASPSTVEFTGRMAIGGSQAMTITTAGKQGMMLFDGVAGQRVSLSVTNVSADGWNINVYDPYNVNLGNYQGMGTAGGFIDTMYLSYTGTYLILVSPWSTTSGSLTLTLNNAPDLTGTITPGGAPVTITTTVPGQNARLPFTANAGQRISLLTTNVTVPNNNVVILNPNGTVLASLSNMGNGSFMDAVTLSYSGTYSLIVNPAGSSVGSMTVNLYDAADLTLPITAGGSPVTLTISAPGQNGRLTFNGTTGQKVSMSFSGRTLTVWPTVISIIKPDGTTLISANVGNPTYYIDTQTLPATGTYTILVDPSGGDTGQIVAKLNDASDAVGTITPGGSPVTASITVPGQSARLNFDGVAGRQVTLYTSGTTVSPHSINVSIVKPDGSNLMSAFIGAGNTLLDNYTLPVSGTYAIVIDPQTDDIGQMTVTLYDSTDVTGTITAGGSAVTITTTVPGQNGRLTFDGTNGQVVSLNVTGGTYPVAYVSILNPDGTTLAAPASLGTGGGFFDAMTLSQTGTYTIFINPSYEYTGNMTMALYNVTDVSGTITVGGSPVNVILSVPGQNASLTFSGTLNQQVTVHVTNSTINCGRVSLLKPDGSELTGVNGCAGSFNLATQTLPVAGTYKVFVNPSQAATGSLTVSVTSP